MSVGILFLLFVAVLMLAALLFLKPSRPLPGERGARTRSRPHRDPRSGRFPR